MGEALRWDVLVIGAGPAGLSAAIYARRALLSTLVLDKALPGGLLNQALSVENFPGFEQAISGAELTGRMRRQAERLGAQIASEEVRSISREDGVVRVQTQGSAFEARAVVLATGSRPRELPVDGVRRLVGRGVSYCATCDGYFFQGRDVLSVGAGDSGLTEALFLTRIARSVGIIVRHPEEDPHAVRASASLRRAARENPRIRFLWNRTVEEVRGERQLEAVILRNLGTGDLEEHRADALFIQIGHLPETEFLRGRLALDAGGHVVTDDRLRTSVEGVFAAGDVRAGASRYAQAIVAAGEGAIAAMEAERYLEGNSSSP